MIYIPINKINIQLLGDFFEKNQSPYFRYYQKRTYENAIKNHIYTVILKNNDKTIGYGHIDYEEKYWVGIYIANDEHNKGYGKLLMNHLIERAKQLGLDRLFLSVDKENNAAIHLYRKSGFKTYSEKETYIIMSQSLDIISLPVSYGEAFDKLSILDIKLDKIKDERAADVLKEYDMIKDKLNSLMTSNVEFHYKILKKINQSIWEKQDIFRTIDDISIKNKLCIDIIEENDRRFRIKNKINNLLNSSLKEQKGYNRKKAFILTHLGLGDHITSMGIVRYYATFYDEMYLVCKKKYAENVRLLYLDDPTIKIYPIDTTNIRDDDISDVFGFSKKANAKHIYNGETYDLITTGMFGPINTKSYTIPFCFYKDVELDYGLFWEYSHINDTPESKELYELLKFNNDYIVIHTGSSGGAVFSVEEIEHRRNISRDKTLILNLEKNIYTPGHHYYELAEKFLMRPILAYKDTFINARQLYLSDSCFFCIAMVLNIKTEDCFIISRSRNPSDYQYIFTEQYKFNSQKTRQFRYPF